MSLILHDVNLTIHNSLVSLGGEVHTEAECILRGNELVIRSVSERSGGEFAEAILADIISQGYQGDELLAKFKETRDRRKKCAPQ